MNNMKEGAYAAGSVGTGSTYATGYTPLFHTNYGSLHLDLGMLLCRTTAGYAAVRYAALFYIVREDAVGATAR